MRRFSLAFFLVLLAFGCRSGGAQTVPDDELSRRFAVRIGAPWKVQAFAVDATANHGTMVEPVVKSRFHADLKLTADTFVLAERKDTASFLTRVGTEGEVRTVFGVATAILRGGGWQVEFDPQNDPVAGSGLPRNAFPGRLVVRGTDEESAYFKEVAATIAADQARLVEQLRSLSESLRLSLTISLGQGWRPTAVTVLATVNTGTATEPKIQSRFTVSLQLASDMFLEKDTAPGVTIVSRVLAAGETRTLAGAGVSTLVDGSWESVTKLDIEPETGRPRDSFNGRVIIAGSVEEEALRRDQEQEVEEKHKAEMIRHARLLEEQAAVAKVAKERQAQEAALREEARQIAEREATTAAAATLKRLEELDAALADKDPKRRRVALDKAFKSSDPMVQNMALRDIFSKIKIFTVLLEREVEGQKVNATTILDITNFKFNRETGEFDNTAIDGQQMGPGRIAGVTLGIQSRLSVTLIGDTMKGFYRGNGEWRASIKLQ